jgi:polyisoprenyl-phosphate glycosyltransferase
MDGAGQKTSITEKVSSWDTAATVPRVTAVVPAYNEAGRIGAVVKVLCKVKRLSEIVVVDDGSQDDTASEAFDAAAGDYRLVVLQPQKNLGKGGAVFIGWQHTRSPFLVMLDADLIHLKPEHVDALMDPVLTNQADMSLGLFKHGYWRSDISHSLTPWLSGQRCRRTSLLSQVTRGAAEGYGLETALTVAAQQGKWRVRKVPLEGVLHPLGELQRGGYHGWGMKARMYAQIVQAWWRCKRAR